MENRLARAGKEISDISNRLNELEPSLTMT